MDTSSASIAIGGEIKLTDVKRLAEAIEAQQVGEDYGQYLDMDDAINVIRAVSKERKPLVLVSNDAAYGKFEALEDTLRDLGLTFVRGDDGHYTWTASVAYWGPGMKEEKTWTGTVDDHEPQLSAAEVEQRLNEGEAGVAKLRAELALMKRVKNFAVPLRIVRPKGKPRKKPTKYGEVANV